MEDTLNLFDTKKGGESRPNYIMPSILLSLLKKMWKMIIP